MGGAGEFLGNEYPLVRLVESLGLDVTYWTDIDLHRNPEQLLAHRALVSLGHDEYWSTRMRRGAEAARAHGVNLAFLGANAVYRHIRLEPSPTGPDRQEVNYKPWSVGDDPAWRTDPTQVTTDWRRPPLNDPESRLLGNQYECNPTHAAGVVVEPSSWLFAGTGVRAGTSLPGLVGDEYDRVQPGAPRPPRVQVLLHSPVRCRGASFADTTYYTAPSRAGVFASGTSSWGLPAQPVLCQAPPFGGHRPGGAGRHGEPAGGVRSRAGRPVPPVAVQPGPPTDRPVHPKEHEGPSTRSARR